MQQQKNMEMAPPYPNNVRQCIKRQGYDIQEVADEIGISRRTMSNYLAGKVPIPRNSLEKIAQTIGCDIEELAVSHVSNKHTQPPAASTTPFSHVQALQSLTDKEREMVKFLLTLDDDLLTQAGESTSKNISRRFLLQLLFSSLGLTLAVSPQVSPSIEQHGSVVSEDLIKVFENTMSANWELYHTGGAARVVHGLDMWIKEMTNLSRLAQGTGWHKSTLVLLTMGYQLQSCVLRDMMNYAQATVAYQKAFHVAQELDDVELMASALARQGVTLIQQERPKEAIIYLSGALDIINAHHAPLLKGHIFQALSEAYAKNQQSQESWYHIGQAETYLGKQEHTQERSLIRGVTQASLSAQKGVNAVLLQECGQAITLMMKASPPMTLH